MARLTRPQLAQRASGLLDAAGISGKVGPESGLDNGVLIPMKIAFPEATIPVVHVVDIALEPAQHPAVSIHKMRGYGDARFTAPSERFLNSLLQ